MQPLGLTAAQNAAYLRRLFTSHNYRVDVEILDLDERVIGEATFLDGQINLQDNSNQIRRTASLTVADPAGALDFTGASTWSGSTIWVDRLIRITHTLAVPGAGIRGDVVRVVPFIGPPSALARDGAEVSLEAQDKTALANRGAPPLTIPKGTNAVNAIRQILQSRTGEFRFRLGTTTKRITKPYSVGWADETSPWKIANQIAGEQLGMQLLYSCDGYATLRKTPGSAALTVPHVTSDATSSVDFTSLVNYVQVSGKTSSSTKSGISTNTTPTSSAVVASGTLSPSGIARKGVRRYLPLVIAEDSYTKTSQTLARARTEIANGSRLASDPNVTCVPFFHADSDDIALFKLPGNDMAVRLQTASIPLGAGEMSVGIHRWVSTAPRATLRSAISKTRTKAA